MGDRRKSSPAQITASRTAALVTHDITHSLRAIIQPESCTMMLKTEASLRFEMDAQESGSCKTKAAEDTFPYLLPPTVFVFGGERGS